MNENYYRVTFKKRGYFSAVHDLLDYLTDDKEYDYDMYYDISKALIKLEIDLYCPDIKDDKAIFAYTEEGFKKFQPLIKKLSEVLKFYGYEPLTINTIQYTQIVYKDNDQIAFIN